MLPVKTSKLDIDKVVFLFTLLSHSTFMKWAPSISIRGGVFRWAPRRRPAGDVAKFD